MGENVSRELKLFPDTNDCVLWTSKVLLHKNKVYVTSVRIWLTSDRNLMNFLSLIDKAIALDRQGFVKSKLEP